MKTFLQSLFFFLLATQFCFAQWYQQYPALNIVTFSNLYDVTLIDANNGWAVGDSGTILKTTDDGINWIEQQSNVTNKLNAVCFIDANNGWAVGDGGTITRTTNGGVSWLQQSPGVSQNLNEVSFCDDNRGLVVGDNGKVLRTIDGGNNWTSQTLGNSISFSGAYLISANVGWIVGSKGTILGSRGLIFRTTDGGQTWIEKDLPLTCEFCWDVFFIDDNTGWITAKRLVEDRIVLKTTNGGTNWISHTIAYSSWLRKIHFEDLNTGWIVGDNGVFKTTDGGIQWTPQSFPGYFFCSISFRNTSVGIIVGGVGTILNSTNGGNDWSILYNAFTYNLNAVAFRDENNGIIVGYSGRMLITSDGGSLWVPHTSGIYQTLNDIQFVDDNYGWAVGDNGTIIKTTNGGVSWFQQMGDSVFSLTAVHFINVNIGWVIGDVVLKTTNGGISWINQSTPAGSLRDVHFIDASTGFIASAQYWGEGCDGSILKTTNGGETWSEQPVQDSTEWNAWHSISFSDSQNGIAVGTRCETMSGWGDIFRTTDGGVNWILAFENDFYSFFFTSAASSDSNYFWVSGFDFSRGSVILFSSDNGLNWTSQIDSGLYNNSLNDICFVNSTTGWAVGDNGLILHTTNSGVPVELTSFTASANGKEVILNWSTATETNNQGFEILRFAQNDNEWETIGYVSGFGTTTEPKSYSHTDSKVSAGRYTYRLKQIDFDGSYEYSPEAEVVVSALLVFSLDQNYPNPFNPNTVISYQLPVSSDVTIKVFDILGNEVATLINDYKTAGKYEVEFNQASINPNLVSGIYVYQLKAGEYSSVKKMILLK
ncbi:MAG: T9SS type A sorting domain-containing protein [bacterium]|nr:T9SS type A sorting domain-containing protein [bacterium]